MTTKFQTDVISQRARLLERLRLGPVSTQQAVQELDILRPGSRIHELRQMGFNIKTEWVSVETRFARHRNAHYVLLPEVRS
jgi:hypothetical protein